MAEQKHMLCTAGTQKDLMAVSVLELVLICARSVIELLQEAKLTQKAGKRLGHFNNSQMVFLLLIASRFSIIVQILNFN